MTHWQFLITPEAEEDLTKLDRSVRKRVIQKLRWLVDNFEDVPPLPLAGDWSGYFKLRVGDWRIIYEVEHERQRVVVHHIGRRDEIYKRRR